jgi:hypothetical protein
MDDILKTTLIDTVDSHTKKIDKIEETIKSTPDHAADIQQVKKELTELETVVQTRNFPIKEMEDLTFRLKEAVALFNQPVTGKVFHHHHVPKIVLVAAGLFLIVCLLSTGWYMTADKLKLYKANDTKYRYLRSYGTKAVQQLLDFADSLYIVTPKLREAVLQREQKIQDSIETMLRANDMEQQAIELRKRMKKKGQ